MIKIDLRDTWCIAENETFVKINFAFGSKCCYDSKRTVKASGSQARNLTANFTNMRSCFSCSVFGRNNDNNATALFQNNARGVLYFLQYNLTFNVTDVMN